MTEADKPPRFQVARLDVERFLVLHPDGRVIEADCKFNPPCSLVVQRSPKRIVVVDVPREPWHSITVLQDLGWLWEVQDDPREPTPLDLQRSTRKHRLAMARKRARNRTVPPGYGGW